LSARGNIPLAKVWGECCVVREDFLIYGEVGKNYQEKILYRTVRMAMSFYLNYLE
jgi:hypothetical protein